MKSNLVKLNNIKEKLQDKLESMEWAMDERSERWHESEAAQIHDDKMSAIDSAIMQIDDAIDELSSAFNLEDLF
jgi:flagellar biosynthesis chaperone FliJ